jgi:hypothetical protein
MRAPRLRKLVAMGIAALVATGYPDVLQRLPTEIFNLWTDVFCELKEMLAVDEASRYVGIAVVLKVVSLRHYSPSPPPSPGRWDKDERLEAYFCDTEGTLEFDRRKAVCISLTSTLFMLTSGLRRLTEVQCALLSFLHS